MAFIHPGRTDGRCREHREKGGRGLRGLGVFPRTYEWAD
jgi:hypothetical protein